MTPRHVKDYTAAKQAARAQRQAAIEAWRKADPAERGRMPVSRQLGHARPTADLRERLETSELASVVRRS